MLIAQYFKKNMLLRYGQTAAKKTACRSEPTLDDIIRVSTFISFVVSRGSGLDRFQSLSKTPRRWGGFSFPLRVERRAVVAVAIPLRAAASL